VFPDPYDSEYSIAVAGFDSGSGATDGTFTLSWTCELAGGGGGGDEGGSIPSIDLDHYLGRAENSTLPNTL
jgi:hypothetical protein